MSADHTDTPEDDDDLDIQVAANSFDNEPVAAEDEDDVIKIEYRNEAVFERFARDIYQSEEAGVREPVANAITAVRRAEELYDIDDGTVEITVQWSDDGEKYLTLRDNGIGIPRRILENVLSVIGNSTSRDDGDVSGKFGMGFLACYMLVGLDGAFIMHTRSRKTGESLSGVWRPGMFEPKDNIAGALGDDEYGTKFIFPLADNISVTDIRRWVKNNVEWAREPVVYREVHNGEEEENDEFGYKSFEDEYDENAAVIDIENEHFRAVSSPDASGTIVLLDSPISGRVRTFDLPWSVDIRLKNENGVVVKGPHAGLTPVKEQEYNQMAEERQGRYVPEAELTEDDLRLPEPTGTRDTLSDSYAFWQWLDEQLYDLYCEEISERLDEFDDRYEFLDMDERDQSLVADAVFYESVDRVQETAEEDFDYEIGDDLAQEISIMSKQPTVVDHNANVRNLNSHNSESKPVWRIMQRLGDDGDVFMGVAMGTNAAQHKANVVWDDNENNAVVKLEEAADYSTYKPIGWRKLREIRSSTIDEFDVSDDVASPFRSNGSSTTSSGTANAGLDAPDRDIKVHARGYGNPRDIAAQDLYETFQERAQEGKRPTVHRVGGNTLVLFPPNAERNISDTQWLIGEGVTAANCTKMVYDYLSDWDAVHHVNEFVSEPSGVSVPTSHGDLTVDAAVNQGKVVLHAMSEENVAYLREQDENPITKGLLSRMGAELSERNSSAAADIRGEMSINYDPDVDTLIYAPVTSYELDQMRGDIRRWGDDVHVLRGSAKYHVAGVDGGSTSYDFNLFAHGRFPEWKGHDEFDSLLSIGKKSSITGRLVSLTETLGKLHDNGIDPVSPDLDPNQKPEPTLWTSEGTLDVSTAEVEGDYLVFHVLPQETVDLFRDDALTTRLIDYVKQESGGIGYSSGTDFSGSDIVYAPVTNAEAQEAAQWLDDQQYYVYGDASTGGLSGDSTNIGNDVRAYAHARLSDWENTDIMAELTGMNLDLTDEGWYFVETLGELHDSGVDPANADDILPE